MRNFDGINAVKASLAVLILPWLLVPSSAAPFEAPPENTTVRIPFDDDPKSLLAVASILPPVPINSDRIPAKTDGITLKQFVDAVGPGWTTPNDGIGLLKWRFTDGRAVTIRAYAKFAVLHSGANMRWSPPAPKLPGQIGTAH